MPRPFGSIGRLPEPRVGDKHRWVIRSRNVQGEPEMLVVQARDGKVYVHVAGVALEMAPVEVSRLHKFLREAQAVALQERGEW